MFEKKSGSLSFFLFENLSKYKRIMHFVSSRPGGVSKYPYNSLNLGFHVGDSDIHVYRNRRILALCLGIPIEHFTICKQRHGKHVVIVTEAMRGRGGSSFDTALDNADAMVTDIPGVCIMVLVADCVPIVIFDPLRMVIGVAHAGRKGTFGGIAQNIVKVLIERFGSSAGNIIVGIGPSIGPCCYEVDREVISQARGISEKEGDYILYTKDNRGFLNLWELNRIQLEGMGIPKGNIEISKICSCCHPDVFFSYRYQKGCTGRFAAGIMIKMSNNPA